MYLKKVSLKVMVLPLFYASFLMLSCHKKKVTAELITSMNRVCTDYNVDDFSYLISEDGTVVSSYTGIEYEANKNALRQSINELTAPFLLDNLVKDSVVKEDSPLNKLLSLREKKPIYADDLIAVPADFTDTMLRSTKGITETIGLLLKKLNTIKKLNVNGYIPDELRMSEFDNTKDLFKGVNNISDFFDQNYPLYKNEDTSITSLSPAWYSHNIVSFFGWNVFKLQKKTILWKSIKSASHQVLLIKYLDKGIFVALGYGSPIAINNNKDLLESPFGIAIVKTLLAGSGVTDISYKAPSQVVYKQLLRTQKTPLYLVYLQELISYANLYKKSGKSSQATILYNVYGKLVHDPELAAVVEKPAIARLDYITDFADVKTSFVIKKMANVQVFATGQAMLNDDYINSPYQYDNLQIFFNKDVDPKLIVRNDSQQFEFNYRYSKIHVPPGPEQPDGWLKNSAIRFAYCDPSDTTYILEVAIPWATLKCPKPKSGTSRAMNIFIGDGDLDENQRKSILSWTVKANEDYNDPNIFGRINLRIKNQKNTDKNITSLKIDTPPIIDGLPDPVWSKVDFSSIRVPFQGNPSPSDNSGRFKSLYDDQNLYLLFEVTDNCKNVTGMVTKDKCWIENAKNHEIVWKMNGSIISKSASFSINNKITLPAGEYNLRYTSDDGNSADGWYGSAPANGIYGARIYNLSYPGK